MRIIVETNFEVGGVLGLGEVELKAENATLRALLEALSKMCQGQIEFINSESGDIDHEEYDVLVNGCAYEFLPAGLETKLNDEDNVSITRWFEPLGGG